MNLKVLEAFLSKFSIRLNKNSDFCFTKLSKSLILINESLQIGSVSSDAK